jgi:hypothetical protein
MLRKTIQKSLSFILAGAVSLGGILVVPQQKVTATDTNGTSSTVTTKLNGNISSYQMENLDKGLIAANLSNGVFLSWRLLKNEVTGYTKAGLTGTDFAVYRDGTKIATVTDSTNYLDTAGTATSKYYVRTIVNDVEGTASGTVTPAANSYLDIPMQIPAPATTPDGKTYTYFANDMSVGDADGDGQYEYFVKFQANNPDVINKGYTANVFIQCYELDGTLKYSIDLGTNIRAGAHYTQFLVADFDGNGKSEVMLKTAPGTKSGTGKYITMLPEDIAAGYKNTDDYRCSSASYYEYLVSVFKNWSNHPEVVNGNWPKTLEECFGIEKKYSYPLNDTDARAMVDYFMDVYAPSRDASKNKLRDFNGYIFTGPEYLTVFDGETGTELKTVAYKAGRDDDGLMWGDYAWNRIEPCNRVDRMAACVAYLDGTKPSAVFGRGYYTRTTLVAYDWNGTDLKERWFVDSGYPVMNNPFNITSTPGRDGRNPEFAAITGQGAHTLGCADVDGDGRDEIIQGSFTLDDNGKLLYNSYAAVPNGTIKKLGHGDSIHVTDILPSRPGLEILMCHENGTNAPYGVSLRDAKTGEVIWGQYSGKDTGRCMVGDVNSAPGLEYWGLGLRKGENGEKISDKAPGSNFNLKWQPDMTTAILSGSRTDTPIVSSWNDSNVSTTLLAADGTYTNNDTKGTPNLAADILGDYREELLLRTTDSSSIRIYFNTEVSTRKMYTLMNDRQYRTDVARQNDCYNQPAYTSFYYGRDMNWADVLPTLASAKLKSDKTSIDRTKTAQLTITDPKYTDGLDADLSKATIKYTSSDPSILDVDSNGKIATYKDGNAEVIATITLYDKVIQTNPVAITVNKAYMDPVELSVSAENMSRDRKVIDINSEVTVKLKVKGAKDLYGFDMKFNYDPSKFDFALVSADPQFAADSKNVSLISDASKKGEVRVVGTLLGQSQGLTGDVSVLDVKLKAKNVDSISDLILVKGATLSNMDTLEYTSTKDSLLKVAVANADINGQGYSIGDIVAVAKAFGIVPTGHDTVLDMNKDDIIDIFDISYVALKVLDN